MARQDVANALEAKGDLSFTVAVETLAARSKSARSRTYLWKSSSPIVPDEDVEAALNADGRARPPLRGQGRRCAGRREGRQGHDGLRGHASTVNLLMAAPPRARTSCWARTRSSRALRTRWSASKKGETRTVKVTFPEAYAAGAHLAGKAAEFEVTAKNIATPGEMVPIDDAFAKGFSFDSLDAMKTAIRTNMEGDFARASRERVKRRLARCARHQIFLRSAAGPRRSGVSRASGVSC